MKWKVRFVQTEKLYKKELRVSQVSQGVSCLMFISHTIESFIDGLHNLFHRVFFIFFITFTSISIVILVCSIKCL